MNQKSKLLRESIENQLKNAAAIQYRHKKMPATTKPPFGVYLLNLVRLDGVVEIYDMTLDLSDYDSREDYLEELADRIGKHLHGLAVLDDNQTWESYLRNRLPIDEADKNIQRIRLSFEIRYVPRMEE